MSYGAAVLLACMATTSKAEVICHDGGVGATQTNWTRFVNVPLFDPSLGTLTQVSWTFGSGAAWFPQAENLDNLPATVTLNLAASLTLFDPNGNPIANTIPTGNTTLNLPAFDGTLDFAGPSGYNQTAGITGGSSIPPGSSVSPSFLAMFTGVGTANLMVTATGTSFASGGTNVSTNFPTFVQANVQICYTFIPAPGVASAVGLGVLLGFNRRRR